MSKESSCDQVCEYKTRSRSSRWHWTQLNNHFHSIYLMSLLLKAQITAENKMQLIAHLCWLVSSFQLLMIRHKVLVISTWSITQQHPSEVQLCVVPYMWVRVHPLYWVLTGSSGSTSGNCLLRACGALQTPSCTLCLWLSYCVIYWVLFGRSAEELGQAEILTTDRLGSVPFVLLASLLKK